MKLRESAAGLLDLGRTCFGNGISLEASKHDWCPSAESNSREATDTIPELDIFRSANRLIYQHGEYATREATMRADKLLDKGDLDGKRAWVRIIAAIEELQRTELGPGETAH